MVDVEVHPPSPSPEIVRTLQFAGIEPRLVETPEGAAVAVVDAATGFEAAVQFMKAARALDAPPAVLVVVTPPQLERLPEVAEGFDDFVIAPFHAAEFEARLRLLGATDAGSPDPGSNRVDTSSSLISFGPLRLDPDTYQATVAGRPLDLTFMEYELLRFLASQPDIVFTREVLLNRVWGYEYYGGARTVDVHVRRLRAKLGEEHAGLIQTVRSVGYRLAQPRH